MLLGYGLALAWAIGLAIGLTIGLAVGLAIGAIGLALASLGYWFGYCRS